LRLLARRPHTAAELSAALRRKGYAPGPIGEAVGAMIESGYIDDRRLAYNIFLSRSKRMRLGRRRLEQELRRRGVAEDDLRAAWESARDGLDEAALLEEALAALLKREGLPVDARSFERLARRLGRRGFPQSEVMRVLRPLRPEAAHLPEAGPVEEDGPARVDDDELS